MVKKNIEDKKIRKNIAIQRIKKLFMMAEQKALDGKLDLAKRYVEIARKISMRCLVPIPYEFKHCYCKYCYNYFLPHVTCRIRIHRNKLIMFCKQCNKYTRIPLKNKIKNTSVTLK